jgi:outer membrane protein W
MLNQFSRSLRGAAGKGGHVMRKLLALTLSAPLLFAASSAFAADDTSHPGGFAAGVAQSMGGVPGLSLRYFFTEKVGVELVGSMFWNTPEGGENKSDALDYSVTWEYRFASTDKVTFSGYSGIGQTKRTADGNDLGTIQTLGAGVKAEYFFARGFSVFGATGLDVVTEANKDGNKVSSSLNIFRDSPGGFGTAQTNILGSMGFSVWFK